MRDFDIIVVGAGPSGLAFARALDGSGLRIALIERQVADVLADPPHSTRAEDKQMLRQAALLTRDLHRPSPARYWSDCFGSAAVGYAALVGAILSHSAALTAALVVLSILTLYRAVLFIHEITHLDHRLLPGFRAAWNIGVGAPLLLPSFLYEGIHAVHHSRRHYGTQRDPEYLPLAHMRPWTLPLFTLAALAMPFLLLLRFGILAPLSILIPPLRRVLVERLSALEVNPAYHRPAPKGAFARRWRLQEIAASMAAIAILASTAPAWCRCALSSSIAWSSPALRC